MKKLKELLKEINDWQRTVFTRSTIYSAVAHLRREVEELYEDPHNKEELADVFILLAGIADLGGIDLEEAVENKMAINRKRLWGDPDAEGVVEHIREESENLEVLVVVENESNVQD